MTTRRASCSCGQLSVTTEGDLPRVSVCHCLACQLRTGSAFGVQARFPRHQIRIEGRAHQYVRIADSGNQLTFSFCPDCGATVHYSLAQFAEVIAIPVGAFSDPAFPPPRFSVYESRRHAWIGLPAHMERSA
jgi:hypothetical protein